MDKKMKLFLTCIVLGFLVFTPLQSVGKDTTSTGPLNILLTNDDGYNSPGLQILRAVLMAAGHNVTVVAPLENQSGAGGSVEDKDSVAVFEQEPGVWTVDNTPAIAVRVGLALIMANNPPDIIISGTNFGQNLGQPATTASGTVCAAHMALLKNVPALSVSVGILIEEYNSTPIPFPSTFSAFAPAANFVVNLLEQLRATSKDGQLLPPRTMLNINIPVPYDQIQGVKFTKLGQLTFADATYIFISGGIPEGGGTAIPIPIFLQGPDPVENADTDAYWDGYISICISDGDMSSLHPPAIGNKLEDRLYDLPIY